MAIDGTYDVIVNTTAGKESGSMTLVADGDVLTGSVTAFGETTDITGEVDGDSFEFETEINSPVGKLQVKITGEVEDDEVSGRFKTPMGNLVFNGERV